MLPNQPDNTFQEMGTIYCCPTNLPLTVHWPNYTYCYPTNLPLTVHLPNYIYYYPTNLSLTVALSTYRLLLHYQPTIYCCPVTLPTTPSPHPTTTHVSAFLTSYSSPIISTKRGFRCRSASQTIGSKVYCSQNYYAYSYIVLSYEIIWSFRIVANGALADDQVFGVGLDGGAVIP